MEIFTHPPSRLLSDDVIYGRSLIINCAAIKILFSRKSFDETASNFEDFLFITKSRVGAVTLTLYYSLKTLTTAEGNEFGSSGEYYSITSCCITKMSFSILTNSVVSDFPNSVERDALFWHIKVINFRTSSASDQFRDIC